MRGQLLLVLIVVAYSLVNLWLGWPLPNFSPLVAVFFCCVVAFDSWKAWLLPMAAWLLIAIGTSWHTGYPWYQGTWLTGLSYLVIMALAFMGRRFQAPSARFGLSLLAPVLFFLLTNGASFALDPRYVKSAGGLLQAMWTGLPSDLLPTWVFFRNSFVSNALFSACFFFAPLALQSLRVQAKPRAVSRHLSL